MAQAKPGAPAAAIPACDAVIAADGAVWVAVSLDSGADREEYLVETDAETSRIVNVVDLRQQGISRFARGLGTVWAMTWDPTEVLRLERNSGISSLTGKAFYRVLSSDASLAVGDGAVWVGLEANLFRIDPATGRTLATIPLNGKTHDVTFGADAVWVMTSRGVSRISTQTNVEVKSIPVNVDGRRRIVFAAASVWIFDGRGRLTRIDPATNQVVSSPELESVEDVIVVGETGLWLLQKMRTGPKYRLVEIDPATNRIRREHRIGNRESDASVSAAEGDRAVWLCLDGRVRRVLLPTDDEATEFLRRAPPLLRGARGGCAVSGVLKRSRGRTLP